MLQFTKPMVFVKLAATFPVALVKLATTDCRGGGGERWDTEGGNESTARDGGAESLLTAELGGVEGSTEFMSGGVLNGGGSFICPCRSSSICTMFSCILICILT